MPVDWSCDACGRKMTALSSCSRDYGIANYKTLCGACAKLMDNAALEVFRALRDQHRVRWRSPLEVLRQILG